MKIFTRFTFMFFAFLASNVIHAQQPQHSCGTTFNDDMYRRLMYNREHREDIMANAVSRDSGTIWVPIVFHVIGDGNGAGREKEEDLFEELCTLNENYLDQNVQFFIGAPFQYHNNDIVYNHTNDATTQYFMNSWVTPTFRPMLNIFVANTSLSTPTFTAAAYYTPQYDLVNAMKSYVGDGNETLTHEIGHYFSLPHPFNGWDGENWAAIVALPANNGVTPLSSPNGPLTEFEDRNRLDTLNVDFVDSLCYDSNGNLLATNNFNPANCASITYDTNYVTRVSCLHSGDFFCGTHPDYNFSGSCSGQRTETDPAGVRVHPNSDNYMSYFGDNCIERFEQDQKDAIRVDLLARNYDTYSPPASSGPVTGSPNITQPASGQVMLNYGYVGITWDPQPNATYYQWQIWRASNSGSPLGTDAIAWGYTNQTSDFAYNLSPLAKYIVRVRGFNESSFCQSSYSAYIQFTTGDWATDVAETAEGFYSLKLFPNPTSTNAGATLEIESLIDSETEVSVFSANGQLVQSISNFNLTKGYNTLNIETAQLSAGVYTVSVVTEKGVRNVKLVIQ